MRKRLKAKFEKSYYLKYSACFFLMCALAFSIFLVLDKSLVEDGGDGIRQRLRAMQFYSQYLRDIISTLINQHKLVIPNWSMSIGQGGDVLGTLQYFAEIGDPIAVLCALVPQDYLPYFYSLVVIIRLYLAGLFFSMFCRYKGKNNHYSVLCGSMIYVFCSWSFINVARYPHWLFPLVYFPLILLAIEMLLDNKRPYLLSLSVMFCAMSNFYYFYLVVNFVVIYVVIKLLYEYKKDIKSIAISVIRIGIFSATGLFLGAALVFPVIYAFASDSRRGVDYLIHPLFTLDYYTGLFASLISYSEHNVDCNTGACVFGLMGLVVLFCSKANKDKKMHKLFCLLFLLPMLFPVFGSIFNGFTYSINRWAWCLVFLEAYVLADQWENLMELKAKDGISVGLFFGIYTVACVLFSYSRTTAAFAAIAIAFCGLILLMPYSGYQLSKAKKESFFLALVMLSIFTNSVFRSFNNNDSYVGGGMDMSYYYNDFYNNEASVVKSVAAMDGQTDGLFRYSAESAKYNAQITQGLSATNYYWSISNSNIVELREKLGLNDTYIFRYFNSDSRTVLNTLEAVRYFAGNETSDRYPYGYSFVGTIDAKAAVVEEYQNRMKEAMGVSELPKEVSAQIWRSQNDTFDIYRNDNSLPMVYAYDGFIPKDEWEGYNMVKRQDSMLQGVVLDKTPDYISAINTTDNVVEIPCSANNSEQLYILDDSTIVTTAKNQTLTLEFEGIPNSEYYVTLGGFDFRATKPSTLYSEDRTVDPENRYNDVSKDMMTGKARYDLWKKSLFFTQPELVQLDFDTSNGGHNTTEYHTREFNHYTGRHDFAINLGYSQEALNTVTITFGDVGTYDVSSIKLYAEKMDTYVSDVEKLRSGGVSNIAMDVDTFSADINTDKAKMVVFAIPYSDGFDAYIDGVKTDIYKANVEYMAIEVTPGEHEVKLVYKTPFRKIGSMVTVISVIAFLIFVIFNERKIRIGRKGEAN